MATGTATTAQPALRDLKLYTNHNCPYAHRAHITLAELQLSAAETIIDLASPRPAWYLAVNPRGLVPTLAFTSAEGHEEILTESAIVAGFLMDAVPSHLRAATALGRAREAWFVKTWEDKVAGLMGLALRAKGVEEKREKCKEWVEVLEKEIEPLLPAEGEAGRFFGGRRELTSVEVMVAPFLLRFWALAEDGEVLPGEMAEGLARLPRLTRWREAMKERPSVMGIFQEAAFVQATKERMRKMEGAEKK